MEGWTATVESAAKLADRPYAVRSADVTDRDAVSGFAGEFDVIVHCVSSRGGDEDEYRRLYSRGRANLLNAFPCSTLIFTSSTSVYAQTDESVVDESSPAEPLHAKGKILRETEDQVLRANGIVMRLGGIHGPGRSFFLARLSEGGTVGAGNDRLMNHIHRDDIVSALLTLTDRRAECPGQIFNVVADQPNQLESRLRMAQGAAQETAPGGED